MSLQLPSNYKSLPSQTLWELQSQFDRLIWQAAVNDNSQLDYYQECNELILLELVKRDEDSN